MAATIVAEFAAAGKVYPGGWWRRSPVPAVAGVSLRVEQGQVLALLGPNRAGKTTLVKLLLSLCRPTSGQVRRLGRPAADRSTLAAVGYVHEHQALPRYLTAVQLLQLYGALALVPYAAVQQRIPRLLERVGLADRAREPIGRFSKGMVQRLALAQALINEPELLVLDEPSEGLDLSGRRLVRAVVEEQKQQGRAVLLVSHVLAEVEAVCDRVAVIVGGRLVYDGTPAELARLPAAGAPGSLEKALQRLYEVSHP